MATRMDEATRRARIRARQWLRKRQEIDSGPHTRCACQHCVNILAEHDRQTEARVRREIVETACNWAEERRRQGRPNERAILLAFAQYVRKQPKVEGPTGA